MFSEIIINFLANYIKMRFAYAAGKGEQRGEKDVKYFVEISGMIECLDTVKDSVKQYGDIPKGTDKGLVDKILGKEK